MYSLTSTIVTTSLAYEKFHVCAAWAENLVTDIRKSVAEKWPDLIDQKRNGASKIKVLWLMIRIGPIGQKSLRAQLPKMLNEIAVVP